MIRMESREKKTSRGRVSHEHARKDAMCMLGRMNNDRYAFPTVTHPHPLRVLIRQLLSKAHQIHSPFGGKQGRNTRVATFDRYIMLVPVPFTTFLIGVQTLRP